MIQNFRLPSKWRKSFYLSKKALDIISDEEHDALKNLAKDKTIIISKVDKENAVVIQDIDSYRQKILELQKKTVNS